MSRLGRLVAIARSVGCKTAFSQSLDAQNYLAFNGAKACAVNFWTSTTLSQAAGAITEVDAEDLEHATGIERKELEAKSKGVDLFHESWLDQPFGTETNPVEVPSEHESRIVGVPDPDDDSIVWWGLIEAGQPPKQIIEGGEFFVLKSLPGSGGSH